MRSSASPISVRETRPFHPQIPRTSRRKLSGDQLAVIAEKARLHQDDENFEARLGARIVVAEHVNLWLRAADKAVLKGGVAVAESLYHKALEYNPHSSKANFKLGHHYFDTGQEERGIQILRESGWLLDVPLLAEAPILDGRLDDAVWEGVGASRPFLIWSSKHDADIRPMVRTVIFAGYTPEALFIAARCEEAHPESLIVLDSEHDSEESAHQDLVEFFLDTNLDKDTHVKSVINSVGAIVDSYSPGGRLDYTVDFLSEAAAHVGEDYWSVEYKQTLLRTNPRPDPHFRHHLGCRRAARTSRWR